MASDSTTVADDEVPPWHPYCGCYGCRAGAAIARRLTNPEAPVVGDGHDA
jgi:hypothetical protein